MKDQFIQEITEKYNFKGDEIILGKAKLNDEVLTEAKISIPLKTLNRHGLIAGATGTGKTKSLQLLAEGLSKNGIPSLLMDIKGDLSGIAQPGDAENKHVISRHKALDIPYEALKFPVELLSLSEEKGVKLKATVSEFGPILFSKILGLNETQEGVMSVIFKYCDDKQLALVDLKDIQKVLQYSSEGEGKEEIEKNYGSISSQSLGAILRKIVALEQQDGDAFFGEPSFEIEDLLKVENGYGKVNVLRLTDIQNKPALFSTFMLSLLAEVYNELPESGDSEKPKLAIFIDEAHLMFKEASKELLSQVETVIKLIRSKGVGIFFCTQLPGDIPDDVLSQLGLKIQHALRGFTAKDRKEIQKAVENYPISTFYKADELITQLGIGEAFVTALNEKGIPTPLAHTYLTAPASRMDILSESEINELVKNSELVKKYTQIIDKESAFEILSEKMERAAMNQAKDEEAKKAVQKSSGRRKELSTFEKILKSPVIRSMGVAIAGIVTRRLLGSIGKKRS
ncbi:MAG: helicase HerA-like domain-containing protein [Flavobacteriales bacterium]